MDSYLVDCPRCVGRTQYHSVYEGHVVNTYHHEATDWMAALECSQCHLLQVGIAGVGQTFASFGGMELPGKEYNDVPERVAAAASEANTCAQVGARRAAVLLARSVIEATAKDKGITAGNLLNKIDRLHDDRLIREYVRDGAHELRHFGNEMAHGDFEDEVTSEDASLALQLMDEVLEEIYQAPARVGRARARRTSSP